MRLRPSLVLVLVAAATTIPLHASAQQQVFMSSYYDCVVGDESRADQIVEEVLAPILDRHVEAGNVTVWGWLSHATGGSWRRANFVGAADLETLLSTRAAIVQEMVNDHGEAAAELNRVCPSHDDYIWGAAADQSAEAVTTERPAVAISQYIRCDINREAEADAIVQRAMAPIYDRFVESGAITAWGYFAHVVGGEFRRLWTISGDDYPSLMTAWGEMNQAVQAEEPGAGFLYNEICPTHVDYMWNTVMARP